MEGDTTVAGLVLKNAAEQRARLSPADGATGRALFLRRHRNQHSNPHIATCQEFYTVHAPDLFYLRFSPT